MGIGTFLFSARSRKRHQAIAAQAIPVASAQFPSRRSAELDLQTPASFEGSAANERFSAGLAGARRALGRPKEID
jgi:hypothetical protein